MRAGGASVEGQVGARKHASAHTNARTHARTRTRLPSFSSAAAARRGAYAWYDRLADGMLFTVDRIVVRWQTRGRRKTMQTGEWTPPMAVITLTNIRGGNGGCWEECAL